MLLELIDLSEGDFNAKNQFWNSVISVNTLKSLETLESNLSPDNTFYLYIFFVFRYKELSATYYAKYLPKIISIDIKHSYKCVDTTDIIK